MSSHREASSLLSSLANICVPSVHVSDRPPSNILKLLKPPGDERLAGAHELYYWQLSYGNGVWFSMQDAAIYVCVRDDVDKIALCRPVGSIEGCLKLIDLARKNISLVCDYSVWIRYCSRALAERLIRVGWFIRTNGWSTASPLDDELFPQVLLTTLKIKECRGTQYRNIRLARKYQSTRWSILASNSPDKRAFVFARNNPPRSVDSMEEYLSFVGATEQYLETHGFLGLRFYHLMSSSGELGAFGITTSLDLMCNRVDGLFFAVQLEDWLAPFFIISIADDLADHGVEWINLGGSEKKKLHRFKIRDFGPCIEIPTVVLSDRCELSTEGGTPLRF